MWIWRVKEHVETVLQYSVFLHHFSRKKAQERVLLIICLNHLLIISRKFGSLIWICMLLFWRSESFDNSEDDSKTPVSHKFFESVVVVFASIRVKPYAELLESNRKLIWKEVDIAGLEIISLTLFPLLCSSRTK